MSDTRRQDPLRRTPPTIDLKAEEVARKGDGPAAPASEGATSIEPTATTGLGANPFPKGGAEAPKADVGVKDPGATKPMTQPNAPKAAETARPGEPKAADAKPPGAPASAESRPGEAAAKSAATAAASSVTANRPATASPSASATSSATSGAKPSEPAKPAGPTSSASSSSATSATGPSIRGEPSGSPVKAGDPVKTDAAKPAEAPKSADTPKGAEPAKPSMPGAKPEPAKTSVPGAKPEAVAGASAGLSQPGPAPTRSPAASATRPEATTPPPSRFGVGTALTAGLLGGIIGAVLAVGIDRFVLTDTANADRIAGLERKIATLPSSPGDLAPRLTALESSLRQATDEARAAGQKATEALARPAGGSAAGPDQEARTGLQALTGRVQDGATKIAANTIALGELGQKLDALGKASSDRLTAVARDIEAFTTHQKSLQADVATLRTGAAALDTRTVDADKRIVSLTDGLGRVSTDLAKLSPAAIQASLRVVVAGRLDDALRHGAPLGPAVSALAKLGTEPPMLAPLRPYADSPAPSPAALQAEFKPLAATITTEPARPDETWYDRGRRVLGKVVTVQAVGDGTGQDVPGLVGRIDSSLGRGAITDAKAAWDQLPDSKRQLGTAFGEKLAARAAAEDAVRRIGTQSLSALDAATR